MDEARRREIAAWYEEDLREREIDRAWQEGYEEGYEAGYQKGRDEALCRLWEQQEARPDQGDEDGDMIRFDKDGRVRRPHAAPATSPS